MKSKHISRPILLVSLGLLGMSIFTIVQRLAHPTLLANDAVRGFGYGVCLGVEIVGVYLLSRANRKSAG